MLSRLSRPDCDFRVTARARSIDRLNHCAPLLGDGMKFTLAILLGVASAASAFVTTPTTCLQVQSCKIYMNEVKKGSSLLNIDVRKLDSNPHPLPCSSSGVRLQAAEARTVDSRPRSRKSKKAETRRDDSSTKLFLLSSLGRLQSMQLPAVRLARLSFPRCPRRLAWRRPGNSRRNPRSNPRSSTKNSHPQSNLAKPLFRCSPSCGDHLTPL